MVGGAAEYDAVFEGLLRSCANSWIGIYLLVYRVIFVHSEGVVGKGEGRGLLAWVEHHNGDGNSVVHGVIRQVGRRHVKRIRPIHFEAAKGKNTALRIDDEGHGGRGIRLCIKAIPRLIVRGAVAVQCLHLQDSVPEGVVRR